ncbi:hypothetical protein FTUN_8057 [Frigoriglobus tundricola]|uniref:Uncharacterized protein n=1 Tax=Frigoriglobus tundricola TaxID=2774151 RepID=A0A6M5Z3T4_9BACT|nr:hypothetical protein FTUN_8057 [Frigoriglobus tundricola]
MTDAQVRTWREMTGPPIRGTLAPFGASVAPSAQKKPSQANAGP